MFIPVIFIAVTSFWNSSSHLLKSSRRFLTTGSLGFTELGMLEYSESKVFMVMGDRVPLHVGGWHREEQQE